MKVKLYFGNPELIKQSGIGRAMVHQQKALEMHNIEYTTDQNETDYDILHINTVLGDSIKPIYHAINNKKKIIYHAHSTKEDFRNSFFLSNELSGFFKTWLVFLYSKADHIITPTPYAKKLLEGYGLKQEITPISNGVDLLKFNPTNEQIRIFENHFNLSKDDIVIISVGWLFERKGFDTFVEMAVKFPTYKFIWFGNVKASKPTMKIKKMITNLPHNVVLPGYVDGDTITGAYGRCDVFFFPTREETEGIVVLEALACKAPILLRDIPVFDPWLINNIHCYKGKDNQDFEYYINAMVTKKVPSLVNAGYEVAKERELKLIGEELLETYKTVLNKK